MNNFIKDNWFKLIISVGIILVCITIGYYFMIYLPKERAIKEDLANQIKCQQDGTELYKSQLKEQRQDTILGNPEFKFNNKLKTCLYKNIIVSSNIINNFIIDVYTNKEIVSLLKIRDKEGWKDVDGSSFNWNLKIIELFGK